MPPDLTGIAERVSAVEARFEELTQAFHYHVERQERYQEAMMPAYPVDADTH